jgi:hypothetical protein
LGLRAAGVIFVVAQALALQKKERKKKKEAREMATTPDPMLAAFLPLSPSTLPFQLDWPGA